MRKAAALVLLVAAVSLPACGEDDEPTSGTTTPIEGRGLSDAGADRPGLVGESGTAKATACELVSSGYAKRLVARLSGRPRKLEREPNDSLDLSICSFRSTGGPIVAISLTLDTATRAVRRYYNLIVEARQLPNIFDPSKENRLQLVRGVGDDRTYGGTGAFWIPSRATLTSIREPLIVKSHVYVEGVADRELKLAAVELAKLAYRRYPD